MTNTTMDLGLRDPGHRTDPTAQHTDSRTAQDEFFDNDMYLARVTGWPADLVYPGDPIEDWVRATARSRLQLAAMHPQDTRHLPPAQSPTLDTADFALRNSGNRTLSAPKRSWKVDLDPGEDRVAGMSTLNLKSMYNDASQMRESLAWNAFRAADVVASRHTYARFGINDSYLGLFSLIEQVDRDFLRGHFPGKVRGNLYKVYCGDLGPGTLEHRVGPDGDDSGRQYVSADRSDQTYRLDSYSKLSGAEDYDDLAALVRVVNGIGLPGGETRFDTDAYAAALGRIFDVRSFLRWAGVNVLAGAWDNYFATPANYYLYNHGRTGPDSVIVDPYFTFIPWDYDNSFGIDYFGAQWQYTDLLDWPASTVNYWRRNSGRERRSRIPLVQNVMLNTELRRYYLDHVEHLLDTTFSPAAVDAAIGVDGGGLWERVRSSAYLESDTPHGRPFTGRQFTNDEVYRSAYRQFELRHDNAFVLGVHHYLRMRYDRAREQLTGLRSQDPAGSSGASFGARSVDV